ncbi:LacI family DNA-binding transcriptional regulator [Levilactobacillus fujinensis]|uniref:LacI family DNA-binding transcriptional regulator n=1 Tax=Levilactobacillus fujinensis TaxID=2486024 RepID=A0ABW1TKI1_9LACO|nr:LacI family DNA-binding transcriptional regulator [Levilactobacillus fujinensis]
MANIKDIARLAGYSPATVSRAINHSGYVSMAAQTRIDGVVAKLDYAPNEIARDLSQGRTANVGVVVPHLNHPYFTQIFNGILTAAFAAEYNVVLLQSKYDADLERGYLEQLHRKAFDALIFTSRAIPLGTLKRYQKYGAVVCCENPGDESLAATYSLREPAYQQAFRWIKAQGYRRIALTLSRSDELSATSQLTLATYRCVFGELPAPELLKTAVTTFQDGYVAAEQWISQGSSPEFIFSNGDDIAAGIRQCYRDQRMMVPPLMGQENQLSGRLLGLPTITHHFQRVGQAAFDLAATGEIKQIPIPAELILR